MAELEINRFEMGAGIVAGTTKRGTTARPSAPYSGFSLCHYTGDAHEHYSACKMALAEYLGVTEPDIIVPRQTHSTEVFEIKRGIPVPEGIDALVTREAGLVIGINTADCVPVLLADSRTGIIAAVHAGWRGAVGGIVEKTVEKMVALGALTSQIVATICPCICAECFEVGEEVAGQFPAEVVIRRSGVKPHIDLPGYVARVLENSGVETRHIAMPTACTKCAPHQYFSARTLGIGSGRNFSFIMKN